MTQPTVSAIDKTFRKPDWARIPQANDRLTVSFVPTGKGRWLDRRRLGAEAPVIPGVEPTPIPTIREQFCAYKAFVAQHARTWRQRRRLDFSEGLGKELAELNSAMYSHVLKIKKSGSQRARSGLLDNDFLEYLIVEILQSDFATNEDVRKEFVNRRKARTDENVLHLLRHTHLLSKQKSDSRCWAECLDRLINDLGIYLPVGVENMGLINRLYRPGNDYSIVSTLLLYETAVRLGFDAAEPTAAPKNRNLGSKLSQRELIDLLLYSVMKGIRDIEVLTHCCTDLCFITSSLAEEDNAIFRAASVRSTLSRESITQRYIDIFEELEEGESVEINFNNTQWFDSDAGFAQVWDLCNREVFGIGPHLGEGGKDLAPYGKSPIAFMRLNPLPFLQPYVNYYRMADATVTLKKTASGEVELTVGSAGTKQIGFGGKHSWGIGFWQYLAKDLLTLLSAGYEHMMMRKVGHSRCYNMTFHMKDHQATIKDLFAGRLDIVRMMENEFLHKKKNTVSLISHNRQNELAKSFQWYRTFMTAFIGFYHYSPRMNPKVLNLVCQVFNTLWTNNSGYVLNVKAANVKPTFNRTSNKKQKKSEEDEVEKPTTQFQRISDTSVYTNRLRHFVAEGQIQLYYDTYSLAPNAFMHTLQSGGTFRNLQTLLVKRYIDYDAISNKAKKISIEDRPVSQLLNELAKKEGASKNLVQWSEYLSNFGTKTTPPEVLITYSLQPSVKSGKLPLDGFESIVKKLIKTGGTLVENWIHDANRSGNEIKLICRAHPDDVARAIDRTTGHVDRVLLDKITEKRKYNLQILKIEIVKEKQPMDTGFINTVSSGKRPVKMAETKQEKKRESTSSSSSESSTDSEASTSSSSESQAVAAFTANPMNTGSKDYTSRLTWACWCYFVIQMSSAKVNRKANKVIEFKYDQDYSLVKISATHPLPGFGGIVTF